MVVTAAVSGCAHHRPSHYGSTYSSSHTQTVTGGAEAGIFFGVVAIFIIIGEAIAG